MKASAWTYKLPSKVAALALLADDKLVPCFCFQ
jgi:hypothetical protein